MTAPKLRLYNTLTRSKEDFAAIDPNNVRMYVCGPTVYDFAHIGNARPAIVFDVLFRLLRHVYGESHVTYVRNITDVDDKINARALRDFGKEIAGGSLSLNEAIRRVTQKTDDQYQKDVTALGCLPPSHQPRATEFVQPRADGKTDMIGLVQSLIDRGHAYEAAGEVLFDTGSMEDYGQLSKRPLDEQIAGARIAVDTHKKSPQDFVLWKLSSPEEPGWDSPWGQEAWTEAGWTGKPKGRPGWHIECSAMSAAYLGEIFDIHGGGLDLIFPHHENEIAQSRCAHGTSVMANYWMHNGFLQVEGQKMSKSTGNFYAINELLETESFGGRTWPGEVLRLAMLMTHYREPIDFSVRKLEEAEKTLDKLIRRIKKSELALMSDDESSFDYPDEDFINPDVVGALADDLNVGAAISIIQGLNMDAQIDAALRLFGIDWRSYVRKKKAAVNAIRRHSSFFEYEGPEILSSHKSISMDDIIAQRLDLIAAKDWAGADRIRDELLAEGIQLKDGKNPETGERVTTWEMKR